VTARPKTHNKAKKQTKHLDPECSADSYRQSLKTFLFLQY